MNNKILLSSLAMDLKRVALGFHRNSIIMAKRFEQEALLRQKEIDKSKLPIYMQKIIQLIPVKMNSSDNDRKAEDALMYSTLIQNYVVKCL